MKLFLYIKIQGRNEFYSVFYFYKLGGTSYGKTNESE